MQVAPRPAMSTTGLGITHSPPPPTSSTTSSSSTSSRRVSLPATLTVSYRQHYRHQHQSFDHPAMLLTPNFSPSHNRSLPSTPLPNGAHRNLPPTPQSPSYSMNSIINEEPERTARTQRLRSFDLRDGHLLDKGFQKKMSEDEETLQIYNRRDSRRATCPDIYLFDSQNHLMRHVVIRIYGNKNVGKKSLAKRIHHLAISSTPETVDEISNDDENNSEFSKMTNFLLNGKEMTLEVLIGSSLESCPFMQSKTINLVMYNVDSRSSFIYATNILERFVELNNVEVLLVANKIDLVRNQAVTSAEGKSAAKTFKCEYIEVSALMEMNIEELWTAILQKIQEPGQRRRPSWVERLLNRGKDVAKSAEVVFHRIIPA
ncbi:unnamed protein product [Caenorhabditis bovis]|uniref:Uncharacterized protein n=1 Tax=Caenorhabditis bovis TaxID=2654633 RepID=A0A8S1E3W6_9PELO|nr:unnamed protein product [Caenorhabditis bovis]